MKKIFGIFAVLIVAAAAVWAGPAIQKTPPYPTTYWAYGTLKAPAGAAGGFDLSGYRVVVYLKTAEGKYNGFGYADTNSQGNFRINIHSDLQLLPLQVKNYYFGVVKRTVVINGVNTNYGINEKTLPFVAADLTNGYKNVNNALNAADLTLTLDQGIQDPTVTDGPGIVPGVEGSANLNIVRDGNDLRIYWEGDQNIEPAIYSLDGDGAGRFTNNINGWADAQNVQHPWTLLDLGIPIKENGIKHYQIVGQFGGHDAERYYKGITKQGFDKNNVGDQAILAAAPAVGKINLTIDTGFNLISVPFDLAPNDNVNAVFGGLRRGTVDSADRIYIKDNPASWGMQSIFLKDDGKWYFTNQPDVVAIINIVPETGYLIKNKGARETTTVLGKVLKQKSYSSAAGFNLFGNVFPIGFRPELLPTDAANITKGGVNVGDRIYIKDNPASWGMKSVFLKDDNVWYFTNQPDITSDVSTGAFGGYFYKMMKRDGQIDWNRKN